MNLISFNLIIWEVVHHKGSVFYFYNIGRRRGHHYLVDKLIVINEGSLRKSSEEGVCANIVSEVLPDNQLMWDGVGLPAPVGTGTCRPWDTQTIRQKVRALFALVYNTGKKLMNNINTKVFVTGSKQCAAECINRHNKRSPAGRWAAKLNVCERMSCKYWIIVAINGEIGDMDALSAVNVGNEISGATAARRCRPPPSLPQHRPARQSAYCHSYCAHTHTINTYTTHVLSLTFHNDHRSLVQFQSEPIITTHYYSTYKSVHQLDNLFWHFVISLHVLQLETVMM